MRSKGFTLVEVLVALAIVATALLAALKAVGEMAQSSMELKLRLLAQLSAENRIAIVRANGEFVPLGERSIACPQGSIAFVCREEVKSTPNPLFRRIEVRVYANDTDEFHYAEVVGIVSNETGG